MSPNNRASPVRRDMQTRRFRRVFAFRGVLSRDLAKSDGARRIPCAPRAYGMPSQPCTRSRNAVAQPVLSIAAGAGGAEPGANRTRRDHPDHDGRFADGAVSGGAVRSLDRRREPSQARSMDDDQPLPELPDDWEAQDSLCCFYEYIELCRQERLAGKRDLPPLFQPYRPQE